MRSWRFWIIEADLRRAAILAIAIFAVVAVLRLWWWPTTRFYHPGELIIDLPAGLVAATLLGLLFARRAPAAKSPGADRDPRGRDA